MALQKFTNCSNAAFGEFFCDAVEFGLLSQPQRPGKGFKGAS